MKTLFQKQKGFTLVEVMIAIGLFTVIMTIGIGAVLGVSSTHRKTETMRAVVDNLSFLMEDMARSMRLGDYFFCKDFGAPTYTEVSTGGQATQDGTNCKSISFEPYWAPSPNDPGNQVVYYIYDSNGIGTIFKKSDTEPSFDTSQMIAVTPAEIDIDVNKSGFTVVGSSRNDTIQPRITIVLVGTVRLGNAQTQFNLQTTVSQRFLDVNSFN